MAGENLLPVEECPDNICDIICWQINDVTDIGEDGDTFDFILFYAERDTIIDSAFYFAGDGDGANGTVKLKVDSTDMTNALNAVVPALIPYEFTIDRNENLVPAGSVVSLVCARNNASNFNVIQLRIRTRMR